MDKVLSAMPRIANPNVLVGFETADDAGVYRLTPDLALVQVRIVHANYWDVKSSKLVQLVPSMADRQNESWA